MNFHQLLKRLSLGENEATEFKTSCKPYIAGRVVCSFLNSSGGFLILGVQDDGTICGVDPSLSLAEFSRDILKDITPRSLISFEEHEIENKKVWVVEVPAGKDIPYAFRNDIFIRTGQHDIKATVDQIRDMVMRRQVEPQRWERRFSDANLVSDIDEDIVRSFIKDALSEGRFTSFMGTDDSPVSQLEALGYVKYGRLTNAGDVLFTSHPQIRHPQVRVHAACFNSITDANYHDMQVFEGPIFRVLDEILFFIERNTLRRIKFASDSIQRISTSQYPAEVVREALVNAFAHRDYADYKGGIAVRVFPDRLEIWNSGDLPEGVSPETLSKGQLSIMRNPDIAHALYLRRLMEKLGRGGALILRGCVNAGLPAPLWENPVGKGVTLTLFAPPTEATGEATGEAAGEVTGEVTGEVKRLLTVMNGEMKRAEIQMSLNLKHEDYFREKYLLPALNAGFIEMTIPDKPRSSLQRYRITTKGKAVIDSKGIGT